MANLLDYRSSVQSAAEVDGLRAAYGVFLSVAELAVLSLPFKWNAFFAMSCPLDWNFSDKPRSATRKLKQSSWDLCQELTYARRGHCLYHVSENPLSPDVFMGWLKGWGLTRRGRGFSSEHVDGLSSSGHWGLTAEMFHAMVTLLGLRSGLQLTCRLCDVPEGGGAMLVCPIIFDFAGNFGHPCHVLP